MSRFVLTAQLQLQAPNNVRQVVQQIQSQLSGVNVNVQVQGSAQAQRQLQQVTQRANQATTAAERMGKAFALSVRRFAAFSVATRAVSLFTSTLSDAVQSAIDFERQLIKVSQVTGKSVGQLRGLTRQITSLSTGFGVASSDLLEVSTVLAQAGLTAEDTSVALRTLAKAALAPNFDSITETAEGAIAILAQFQQGVGALEAQLGSINAVAGAFAVEASDLIDVIRRTGGVFKASGGSLNELLALFTSVRATTRESAESIGTGLRTIFTRIQRPKTIEFLKQFGVELVDLNGKFVGPYEAIKRLSEALSGLGEGDLTFISIAEELGGFRQIGKVLPLLQQFTTAQQALNVATRANDSLTQDAASAQAALAIRIIKVKEEFLALIRSITETSTFQVMANTALSLASALIKIADSIKPLLPLLAALAAVKITRGLGGFLGGMMSGAASGRTYNQGGKVLKFARGGLVPGSGNGDTVPAMLAPGEFVIRKSSVNKMGAGTLHAMNENRYAKGGAIQIKPGAIGGFFLQPEKGEDRKVGLNFSANINNPKALSALGNNLSDADRRNQTLSNMTKAQQERLIFGRSGLAKGKKLSSKISDDVFTKSGDLKANLGQGQEVKAIVSDPKFVKKIDKYSGMGAKVNSQSVPITGALSTYFPGRDDLETSNIASIVSSNTATALRKTTKDTIDQVSKSLQNPILNFNESLAIAGASRISNDANARKTTEGFIFEGLIDGITGAALSGGSANFDFPSSSIAASRSSLASFFTNKSGEGIGSLIKADAKRSNSRYAIDSIKSKIVNDINTGNLEGLNFVKKFFGGTIQKFATGGEAQRPQLYTRGTLSYSIDDMKAAAKRNGMTFEKFKAMLDERKDTGWRDFVIPEWELMKRFGLSVYRPPSPYLAKIEAAKIEKEDRIATWKQKQGMLNKDYEGQSREQKEFLAARGRRRRFATGGGVGTDTVPALLTPGEFVINRSSAQRIGYGNLNRMNKVGKYANGGIVQRFANGTSGSGAKPAKPAFDLPAQKLSFEGARKFDIAALKLASAMDSVTAGGFTKFALGLNSLVKSVVGGESVTQQYQRQLANLNSLFPGFSAIIDENAKLNRRSVAVNIDLVDSMSYHIQKLQESGASQQKIKSVAEQYANALAKNSRDIRAGNAIVDPSKPTSPASSNKTAAASIATGAIVQPAVGPAAGGAGKSPFASNQTIASLESFAPGLTKSLSRMAQATNMSAQEQEELAAKIEHVAKNMQQAGKPVADVSASLQRLKARADARTSDYEKAKVPFAPMSDARMLETAQANSRAALKGVVGGFAQADDGKLKSTATEAFETGQSRSDLAKARKKALQDAGFVKGSNRTTSLTTKVPEETFVPDETKEAKTSRILQQARQTTPGTFAAAKAAAASGKFDYKEFGVENFKKLSYAQQSYILDLQKASAATKAEAAASTKAANADNAEANASNKAAAADNMESKSGGGGGGMMGGGKMMAASMAAGLLSSFLPAVDEASSATLKMAHNVVGLITTLTTVGFALEAFGVTLNAQSFSKIGSILSGGLGSFATKAGNVAGAMSGFGGSTMMGTAISGTVSSLTAIAVPAAAAAATFYVVKTAGDALVESIYGYEAKLKKAIEEGNVDKARTIATDQQSAKMGVSIGAGAAAGGVAGFILGGPIGAAIGIALGGTVAAAFSDLPEYAGAVAASQAAQVDVQNKLTKATEESSAALEEYNKGAKTGAEVLKTFNASTAAVAKQRAEANKLTAIAEKNKSDPLKNAVGGAVGGAVVGAAIGSVVPVLGTAIGAALGAAVGGIGGYIQSNSRNARIDAEAKGAQQELSKSEQKAVQAATPALNALGRDVALAGGNVQDFMDKIKETDPNLYEILIRQGTGKLNESFQNIAKEVEKSKKAFEALNLGLRAPVATATAASSALSNFTANLEVGSNPVTQSVATLEAAFSEAGQAMDPKVVGSAINDVAATLEEFGASDASVNKFKENAAAFAAVSANYNEIFKGVKEDFTKADFKNLNAEGFKDKFAANLDEQLKNAGIGEEARKRMGDIVGNIKLDDEDMKKLRGGDLSVFQKYLDEAGNKTLEEAKKIAEETAKINQQLIGLTKQRIEAERNLVQAQQEAIDLFMEGREVQGKYGGRAVTTQERRGALLARSNVEASRLGLSSMRTGDVGELRRRNAEIRGKFSGIESQRTKEGGMKGVGGTEADATQQDLQKAYKTQIDTIRGLIKLEEEQLKITEEKNKLEKESMESLVKGDVEAFFKQQSAVGATAAIASGDQRLMNQYGAEALGTAALDIKRQQDAGVQTLYGQQLAGPGGLTEAASSAALSARGVTDMRAAQVMAGTTAEEQASKARLQELGGMLGETGQLGTEMAEMQVQTATVNINTANLKLEEIKERGRKVAEEAERIETSPAVAQTKARGGLIYANRGIFVPRGTDTVPAMLTPGEFVVNRGAVQRGNNLQILQAMNGGAGVSNSDGGAAMMARGGTVRYLSGGSQDAEAGGGMFANMSNFVNSLSAFGKELSDSITKLTQTNIKITLDSTNVSINLNDGGLLKALTGQVKQELFGLIENQFKVVDGGRLKRTDGGIVP